MDKRHSQLIDDQTLSLLSSYLPSLRAKMVLKQGGILAPDETPQEMLERVVTTLFSVEELFGTPKIQIKSLMDAFGHFLAERYFILGTPTLTNAGRHAMALASCVVIPVDLQSPTAAQHIRAYYQQNMGSGYQFTEYPDPVAALSWVNDLALHETATGTYERYIGNMGLLHVSHPRIREFVQAKRHHQMAFFNISVDVNEHFMQCAETGSDFENANGNLINAADLLDWITENAWFNGDPGLVFMERLNHDNALEGFSNYVSTPPCAEMGLAAGETSQFGYLNLRRFVRSVGTHKDIDYDMLHAAIVSLTRALDNAIEYSLPRYPSRLTANIARLKRKMGIGVCGLADLFLALRLPYDSADARSLARDLLSFITYTTKKTSVQLAEMRGSCLAMHMPLHNKYLSGRYLEDKYQLRPTRSVSAHEWESLAQQIRATHQLRNIATTALAPTGRSSILLDVTSSIEPIFSIYTENGEVHQSIIDLLAQETNLDEQTHRQILVEAADQGSFQNIQALPLAVRQCVKTASEIAPVDHLKMVAELAGLQGVVDESASKTVNLPQSATPAEVKEIFLLAFHLGIKNISVYRDQTLSGQPMSI